MNKKFEEFNNILKNLYKSGNQNSIIDLYKYYNENKIYIQNDFIKDKNNILNIDDNEFNLSELVIVSLDSYKDVVLKYCDFIETFIVSNEEITENNIKKTIIDIICFLHMKDNIIEYIIIIPEHNQFFYNSGLFLYDEKLILELCEKRINENLYKILVKNLVYYKIKYDLTYNLSVKLK
jgi:hypothetical protein